MPMHTVDALMRLLQLKIKCLIVHKMQRYFTEPAIEILDVKLNTLL